MVQKKRLSRPSTVKGQWLWMYVIPIIGLHLLALFAFVPWLFSWTSVAVMLIGVHCYGCLGINLCYHRLLAHRSLRVPKWFERVLVTISLCCLQDTPAKWVANHRMHHRHSDEQPDPHSPLVSFFWGHFDWLMKYNSETRNGATLQKYARDLLADPYYMALEKTFLSPLIYFLHTLLYFVVGFGIEYWSSGGNSWSALQFGLSLFLWGAIVRTVVVWHITWSVNSLTHLFGYRNYETTDNSRNNWLVALIATGEGWHNNHHHDQASATVQHRWWEIDLCYYHILVLKWCGLASHIVPPASQRRVPRSPAPSHRSKEEMLVGAAASEAQL